VAAMTATRFANARLRAKQNPGKPS